MLDEATLYQWMGEKRATAGRSDGGGLTITVSKTGTATWVLRYRLWGRRREMTIGRFPEIGIERAREIAEEARYRVACGIDVADERNLDLVHEGRLREIRSRQALVEIAAKQLAEAKAYLARALDEGE